MPGTHPEGEIGTCKALVVAAGEPKIGTSSYKRTTDRCLFTVDSVRDFRPRLWPQLRLLLVALLVLFDILIIF